jgi:bacillithiol synthase
MSDSASPSPNRPDRVAVRAAPLGGSPLSRAIQRGDAPASWQVRAPNGIAAWRAQVDAVRSPRVDWLEPLQSAFGGDHHSAARRRLAEAARDGVVVTTGQQPGLFGGPAYTLTKALSALALANELSAQLRIPVAPVFWAATDDADWQEAAVTHVVGRDGLQRLAMSGPPTEGIAMSAVPLGDTAALRAELRAACGSVADALVLDLLDATYTQDATVGSAYVAWLRGMLEPLGIAVLDASHAALRTAADPFMRSALRQSADVERALAQREQEIVAAGFAPQVEQVEGLSLVFETVNGVRSRVPRTAAETTAATATVGSLGANVLLRPIVERALMPTVAYVAGPGELAYFAQVTAAAAALSMAVPVAVPRCGITWESPHIARVMGRLGVTADDLAEPHVAEGKLARAAMNRDVTDALERLSATLTAQVAALGSAITADGDLVPAEVVSGLARDLAHRVSRVERRLVAGVKRREVDTARDLAVARAATHPLGSAPERVLSFIPVLARYGPATLADVQVLTAAHAQALLLGGVPSPA